MTFPEPTWWNGDDYRDLNTTCTCCCEETPMLVLYRGEWWCEECIEAEELHERRVDASR